MSKKFIFFLIFVVFVFLILHLLGWHSFYYTTIWYDKFLHFLAGASIFFIAWRLMGKKIFTPFLFLLIVAALWEVFEFSIDKVFDLPSLQLGASDTFWDLAFDIFGGGFVVFVLLVLYWARNMVKSK